MNKYKRLLSNTFIFAIGTFSSKILVFLLMPLYTSALTKAEYGTADLIYQTGNLLLPLTTLGIINAIIRFGLDKNSDKSDVFSTGLITIALGFLIMLCFYPLINMITVIEGNVLILYGFILMSSLRSLCSQFVRAKGYIKLYAMDGVVSTITTILFSILFLVVIKLGVIGYILAMICSDFLSAVLLFIVANLKQYVKFQGIRLKTTKGMLKYSVPLIPNTICWWITNVSDRFLIVYILGSAFNGLYAVAAKLPTAIMLVSSIFMDAWQISAITEENDRKTFFGKVFKSYSALIFMAGSGIIVLAKPLVKLLASDAFYPAWQYIPFLVVATVFNCFGTFTGSVYTVEKKSVMAMVTTLAGAITNIVLNFILIPFIGVNGAAFATFISYLVIFVLRAITTRKYLKIDYNIPVLLINSSIIIIQSVVLIMEIKYWIIIESVLLLVLLLINMKQILMTVKKLLNKKTTK